jgi:exonuclease SbcD
MFKFIHAADIHLDSPLRGLERYEGAPVEQIRLATREALVKLVDTAISQAVAFVVIAGDLFDGEWKDYNTGLFFVHQMSRLRTKDIPVYIVKGNHDATNKVTKSLPMPPNVFVFDDGEPQTFLLDGVDVALHGQSFSTQAVLDNLSAGYPAPLPGRYNVGVLHTCADGKEGHAPYAPCKISELVAKGYDYWALGHVHKREVLSESPLIIFPGNIQGRHIHESGAKGCTLVTVDDKHTATAEAIDLCVLRWENCTVDVADALGEEEVLKEVSASLGRLLNAVAEVPLAVRVDLIGACPADGVIRAQGEHFVNKVRAIASDVSSGRVWVEKVKIHTAPELILDPAAGTASGALALALSQGDGPIGELLQMIGEYQQDAVLRQALRDELTDLERKLPEEVKKSISMQDEEFLKNVLEDVQSLLLEQLAQAK